MRKEGSLVSLEGGIFEEIVNVSMPTGDDWYSWVPNKKYSALLIQMSGDAYCDMTIDDTNIWTIKAGTCLSMGIQGEGKTLKFRSDENNGMLQIIGVT